MERFRVGLILCLFLSALCAPLAFAASDYRLDWWSADGGGGSSSGSSYAVAGSVGQPDAGVMSGDGYTVSGGVWEAIPTATPTATVTVTATPAVTPSPSPVPTLNAGSPSSNSAYLPLILNGSQP